MTAADVRTTALATPHSLASRLPGRVGLDQLLVPAFLVATLFAAANISSRYRLVPVLAGLVAGSFVLALNDSSWLVAPLLLTEMTISNDIVPGINVSLRLTGVLIALVLAAPLILRLVQSGDSRVRRVLLPALAMLILATAVNLLTSDLDYASKSFRYALSAFLTLLVVAAVVRSSTDAKRVMLIGFVCVVVSSVAAIWQHLAFQSAPYGEVLHTLFVKWHGRAMGLADSPIYLACDVPVVLVPVLGFLACGSWRPNLSRVLLAVGGAVCGVGLYLTYTRSAMLAVGAGIVAIAFFVNPVRRAIILASVVGIVLLYLLLHGTGTIQGRYYRTNDNSAATHWALWLVDLGVAMNNPIIGVGHQHFEEASALYASQGSVNVGNAGGIGTEQPHNDFLSVWASWGIATLVAYLAMLGGTLVNYVQAARSPDLAIRGLAVGAAAGLVAYAVNSAFHNLMDTSTVLWMYAGFSVALALIAVKTRPASRRRGRPQRRAISAHGRMLLWG